MYRPLLLLWREKGDAVKRTIALGAATALALTGCSVKDDSGGGGQGQETVVIAVSPAGFAESGNLYAWQPNELTNFSYPGNGAVNGKIYQLPANSQTIPVVHYNKGCSPRPASPPRRRRTAR
jgi:hypothetical protein